jgi:heme exporter protein A
LLLSKADIWYLDEPYTALDKEGVEMVNKCMDLHRKRGGAVVLSTHQKVTMDSLRTYSLMSPVLGANG